MSDERRRCDRFPMAQAFDLKQNNGAVISAQGINISESGLFCRTGVRIDPGEKVFFTITIPGSRSDMRVDCDGVVFKCTENSGGYDLVIDLIDRG